MKKIIFLSICLFAGSVNAATIVNGFNDEYDVSNWTQSLSGGSINTSGAPLSIIEVSSNSGGGSSNTDFTIAAEADGIVSFDWLYNTADIDGSSYDRFGWLLNGLFTQLTVNGLFTTQLGSESFLVTEGDIFGFRSFSSDSVLGASTTTISNFSAPVPEPETMALLGLSLVSFGVSRKRKYLITS